MLGSEYWMFLALTLVGMVISSLVPVLIVGPMVCGIYLCYLQRMRGKSADFETLFRGFDYFLESLLATLLVAVASVVLIAPGAIVLVITLVGASLAGEQAGVLVTVLSIVGVSAALVLWSFVVSALFLFVYPLIVDKNLTAVPAVLTSCRAVWANLGGVLLAMILFAVIACAGVLACGIGTVFVVPVIYGAKALLYRQIFPERPPVAELGASRQRGTTTITRWLPRDHLSGSAISQPITRWHKSSSFVLRDRRGNLLRVLK